MAVDYIKAFLEQDFDDALVAYQQAQEGAPELAEPYYNAANAHYRSEAYGLAQQQVEQALVADDGEDTLNQFSFYNLGNNLFRMEQYEGAVEAYIEALRLDPDDLDAKQNLELALRMLQEQQNEQNQPSEQSQDQQQDSEQDKDAGDEQQEGEQNRQSADEPQEDQRQSDEQEQQGSESESQTGDEPEDKQGHAGQQQPHPGEEPQQDAQPEGQSGSIVGLTEEQARQLLAAAAEGTESLEQFLQQILMSPNPPPAQDW